MRTIDKLKRLRDNNPNFADVIEKEFPEIINVKPYVYNGTMFMKSQYPSNLYQVYWCNTSHCFRIRNIVDNKSWKGKKNASNEGSSQKLYLTKNDFEKLLKQSGCSLPKVALYNANHLREVHQYLF